MINWSRKRKWPDYPYEEVKKRARILVIDDNEFPYRELFVRDGYNIDKWNDIDNLPLLERGYYDIILLDIQGVGRNESEEQGFGILKHLRTTSPAQIIVAYSNSDWALKYQQFFDMADDRLDKRQDYVDFKRIVDRLLKERFSVGFYLDRVIKALGPTIEDSAKARKIAENAILTGKLHKLENYLNQHASDKTNIQVALSIAQVAIGLASL